MGEKKIYFSSNLKYLRVSHGKTLLDLSKVVDKSTSSISYWENGDREPSAVDLAEICDYFGVSIDDMLLKDLRFDSDVVIDEHHKLDLLATEKAKTLSVEDKQWLISTIDMINKSRDNQEENK